MGIDRKWYLGTRFFQTISLAISHMASKHEGRRTQRKDDFIPQFYKLFNEYSEIIVIKRDQIGSNQLQRLQKELRGIAQMIVGKNVATIGAF